MVANLSRSAETAPSSIIGRLLLHAEAKPDHQALVSPTLRLSYAQLTRLVCAQADKLNALGVAEGSVVGIHCADDAQHLILCLASAYAGATSITVPSYEPEEIRQAIIDRCSVTHVLDEQLALGMTAEHDLGRYTGSPATTARLLFSTSGTTGDPKLVLHHDSDLVAQAHRHIDSDQERFACLASMEHNFAKRHRLYCIAVGATNVFPGADRGQLVAQCLDLNVNVIHVSAFQAQELLATPNVSQLSSIRLKLGGSHFPETLRQQLRDNITPNLQAGYGTTESGAIAFTDPNDREAGESVGQALPGMEIRIVSPDRQTLSAGEHGEVALRCAGMFREYLGKPKLTATRLDNEGWFYTGDIGYLDDQQRIHLSGRADDMFVFNSMNIYPQDIEARICQFPGIVDAAVLPKKSAVHGCIPIALVVFSNSRKPKLAALEKFVRERVGLRCPRQFIRVDKIPRNASGKIARGEAVHLSIKMDQHRKTIIQSLDERTREQLTPTMIAAFEKGDIDIRLPDISMDSLARMELLIALEINYDLIITPKEFRRLGSLGKIAERLLSQKETSPKQNPAEIKQGATELLTSNKTHLVRLFQRAFSYCQTVAQLNKVLVTFEPRLTPAEINQLHDWHRARQLIPAAAASKFHTVFELWIERVQVMMAGSGKPEPEPFVTNKIAPTVRHFEGPGERAEKTLLICFAIKGGRSLMMPNAVLLQHTDSSRYDLLVVAEPRNERYELGVPSLGNNVDEVIDWLAQLDLLSEYENIRTMGSSAGSHPAVIAGYRLGAELAVSVGGRFQKIREARKFIERIADTRRAVRDGRCDRVLLCFGNDKTRDLNCARIMNWLTGGTKLAIEFANDSVGHLILERLVERNELALFLERTVFADAMAEHVQPHGKFLTLSFPQGRIIGL